MRLAAKLTGWNIDIVSTGGTDVALSDGESVEITESSVEDAVAAPSVEDVDAAPDEDPAVAAGVMPTESAEIVTDLTPEVTILPAEEELVENAASSETVADRSEDRDPATDE